MTSWSCRSAMATELAISNRGCSRPRRYSAAAMESSNGNERRRAVANGTYSGARVLRYLRLQTVTRVAHLAHNQQLPARDRLVRGSHQSAPEGRAMTRVRCARLLSLAVITALPLGALAPACSSGVGTAGQRISCSMRGGSAVDCRPMTATEGSGSGAGSGSDTCEDIDEDGDGTPHDEGEDDAKARMVRSHDGTADSADDDDDDGDGIENERDCDNQGH